jgi:Transposase DDE domain group 1
MRWCAHGQAQLPIRPRKQEILDIDDTFCAAHGAQQLAFWNAHHDERGFASMHIHHVASGTIGAESPAFREMFTAIRRASSFVSIFACRASA